MHIDARHLENNSVIEGDVCIIGAGVAGITLALQFLNTPYKIVLLEGGGFNVEAAMQELYRGRNIGQRYYPLHAARLHYFGGTSGHWGGFCSMLDPIDFQDREWIPFSQWPIRYEELFPYYSEAAALVELTTPDFSIDHWKNSDPEFVPLAFDDKAVQHKMLQFSPPTRFGKTYRDAIVQARNVHLYTYANVVDIQTNEQVNSVTRVRVKNHEGREFTVKAGYFVSACCALQNTRLLLASDSQAKKGLGNDYDLVGRFFMDHLEVAGSELILPADKPFKLYRPWSFGETAAHAELRLSDDEQKRSRILNGTVSLVPIEVASTRPANIDSFSDDPAHNVELWEALERKGNRIFRFFRRDRFLHRHFRLFTRLEQCPNPQSRVMLDQEVDALGVRRIVLDWKFTSLEKHSLRVLHETIGREAGRLELGRVRLMDWLADEGDEAWPPELGGGWHHMGTTRMSDSPKQGVVDSQCRVHGIGNLYMAGSSCFPTSGSANPTLSIVALTLRLADHLKSTGFSMGV